MRFEIEMKVKSFCVEDLDEVEKELLPLLYKKYVVNKSGVRQNDNQPGVHRFIRLKPMPISVLGDSGRESI